MISESFAVFQNLSELNLTFGSTVKIVDDRHMIPRLHYVVGFNPFFLSIATQMEPLNFPLKTAGD